MDEVIINPKGSVAAQNRFVYYPDHLVRMPGPGQSIFDNLWTIISEPAFKDWWQMILEPIRDAGNLSGDETIGSFLHRRLGTEAIGNNLASAVIHGIYAGDINKLSARCIFGALVAMERGSAGSIMGGMAEGRTKPLMPRSDAELMRELQFNIDDSPLHFKLAQASVYSFKEGIGALSKALDKRLRANPNVTFKSGSPVTGISYENGGIKVCLLYCHTHSELTRARSIPKTLPSQHYTNTPSPPSPPNPFPPSPHPHSQPSPTSTP